MRKILIIGPMILCAGLLRVNAQQIPLYNTAVINPFLENPAVAGSNSYSQSFLHYKKQWVDIEGAPESALLSVDWPLKDEKSGLGLIVSTDKTNILGHIGIATAYSHGIKFSDDQGIRLGLSLRLNHNTIYFDKVIAEDQYEATLFNYFESATGLNANFGALYRYQSLQIGLVGQNLINTKLEYSNNTEKKKLYFQYIPQYLFHFNYTFCLPNEICLRPEIAIRNLHGMPAQIESSIFASYQGKYSATILYRNNNALGFTASALVYDRLTVAYSFQAAVGEIAGYNGGSHEISLGYRFYTSHFQDQKPEDAEKLDQIIEFAQKQVDDNKSLEEENAKLQKQHQQLNEQLKNEKEEVTRLKEELEKEKELNEWVRRQDETSMDDISEDMLTNLNEPIYLILGVFSEILSAKNYQQVLRREHQLGTEILKRKDNDDYIVCINRKFNSKTELRREIAKLNKITRNYHYSDVWIYVNE